MEEVSVINHMSYAVARVPELVNFLRTVDERLVKHNESSFWPAVEGFESIIQRDIWDQVFSRAAGKLVSDPLYNGGRDWGVQGFLLCESDAFHFSVRSTKRKELGRNVVDPVDERMTAISSTMAAPSVIFAVGPEKVGFHVFSMPSSADLDVFDPTARIESRGGREFLPWTRIDIDAPRETLELNSDSAEHCCIVELAMKPSRSQRWEFDRNTGAPLGAVMLSRESVVIKSMLGEIERFRYVPAISQVADLIDHPDFNVRWACMKCAFSLDSTVGRKLLDRLTTDSNPYVRNSALGIIKSMRGSANHAC
ncbi:hypothetical protein L2Y96_15230 [Luteibacter aegosomaticola]|uniref:HEAT repeat domain-containing protein n=1 Tax=Luteibacter aegosomaticola TaxID=2911538 RepID=UPI001FF7D94E|nr:HEAT repeat domain-containing protein [Luteibacter aegosomaticola]UPG88752.1 hypothetical protein L2Y96_15230 [Luteibacter aegosomaticola]